MRLSFRIVLLVLAALTLAACDAWNSEVSLNRKMTVEVETPNGLKTGSSVVRIWAKKLSKTQRFLSGGNAGAVSVRGEAVVVDLGDGKYLFASNGIDLTAFYQLKLAWGIRESSAQKFAEYLRQIKKDGGLRILDPSQYPTLLNFTKLSDPTSVKIVTISNITKIYGEKYKIKSISLEVTKKSITIGEIERVLKWFLSVRDIYTTSEYRKLDNSIPEKRINTGHFMDWRTLKSKRDKVKKQ